MVLRAQPGLCQSAMTRIDAIVTVVVALATHGISRRISGIHVVASAFGFCPSNCFSGLSSDGAILGTIA